MLLLQYGGKRQPVEHRFSEPSVGTTATSQSPSHWHSNGNSGNSFLQLLTVWVIPPVLGEGKAGGHQADKGKHQGQEFLMHQLRYTKTVLCNLIFFLQKFPDLPCAFLPSSKQWKQSRILLAYRIGEAQRRMRDNQFCTTSGIYHFSRFSSCQKTGVYIVIWTLSVFYVQPHVSKKKFNGFLTISKTHQLFLQLQYRENIKQRINIVYHINYQCFLIPNRISCRYTDKSKPIANRNLLQVHGQSIIKYLLYTFW